MGARAKARAGQRTITLGVTTSRQPGTDREHGCNRHDFHRAHLDSPYRSSCPSRALRTRRVHLGSGLGDGKPRVRDSERMRALYLLERWHFTALLMARSTRRESVRNARRRPQCGEIVAAAFIAHSLRYFDSRVASSSARALAGLTPRLLELRAFIAVERIGRFPRAAFRLARFRERMLRGLVFARRQLIAFAAQLEPLGRE